MVCICPSPAEWFQFSNPLRSHLFTLPSLLVPTNLGHCLHHLVLFFNFSITDVCEVMLCCHFGLYVLLFMFLFLPPAYETLVSFCSCSSCILLFCYCRGSLYFIATILLSGIALERDVPKPGMVASLLLNGIRSPHTCQASAPLFSSFSTSLVLLFTAL